MIPLRASLPILLIATMAGSGCEPGTPPSESTEGSPTGGRQEAGSTRRADAGAVAATAQDGGTRSRDGSPRDASVDGAANVPDASGAAKALPVPEGLHPQGRPYKTGYLRVSKIHELYFELYGNPKGIPVIGLHGGPGGRAGPYMRQFFDADRFQVLLFDQRGAGRSRPRAEHRDNTTALLIDDIDTLRAHLGFPEQAILFGGSWGSTLAVAYAEAHPEKVSGMVLRGVFLASRAEIDHFYHGGVVPFFPGAFAELQKVLPRPEEHTYPQQLFEMITKGDAATRRRAVRAWARYEIRMVAVDMTDERADEIVREHNMEAFSTLENHYMMNDCFLEEGQLLRDAHKIAKVPTYIVNGRYDVICPPKTALALAKRLDRAKVEIVPGAAHSSREKAMGAALLRGVEWVAKQVGARR